MIYLICEKVMPEYDKAALVVLVRKGKKFRDFKVKCDIKIADKQTFNRKHNT
jgi:hypothetical protein